MGGEFFSFNKITNRGVATSNGAGILQSTRPKLDKTLSSRTEHKLEVVRWDQGQCFRQTDLS